MKFEWETIKSDETDNLYQTYRTCRAKVFGGWIVQSTWWIVHDETGGESTSLAMTFVSDPKHEWSIDEG